MANLGDVFSTCPEGFTRIFYTNSLFEYNLMSNKRTWGIWGASANSSVTFYVKNVTDLRFINLTEGSCGVAKIYLNDVDISVPYYSNLTGVATNGSNTLAAELFLTKKYNKIHIQNTTSKQLTFCNIDVNEGGELISKEEYIEKTLLSFILKVNDTYKTYNESTNALDDIEDITTLDSSVLTKVSISSLSNALSLLPSLSNVKLIISKNDSAKVYGQKTTSELLVMKNDFFTSQISMINSIFTDINLTGNGSIKLVISTDSGLTWKTYTNDNWLVLPITIPQNKYDKLTLEEKTLWDNALAEINTNGIDYNTINSIDFNVLDNEKIRFAITLTSDNYNDVIKLKSIMCNIKKNDYLKECSCEEVEKIIVGNVIKLKSNINTDKLVVNISTIGISDGTAFDYNSAENKPMLGNTILQGVVTLNEVGIASKDDLDTLSARVDVLSGDKQTYKGYFATETDRDTVITSPEEGDYCVVDSSENTDVKYMGKTLKYTYQDNEWQIYMIVPTGQVEIDDNSIDDIDKTWSAKQICNKLQEKQNIINKFNINIDASQLVKEESGDYENFYKVTITHNLNCGSDFNLKVLNTNNQPCNLCVVVDNITDNSFDLYTYEKQTLIIKVIEI